MDKVYRSKVDWWLGLVIGMGVVAILTGSVSLLFTPSEGGVPNVWIALGMLLMAMFMVWILFSVRYTITPNDLVVRAACFRWRIPLDQVSEVYPTHRTTGIAFSTISHERLGWSVNRMGWCGATDCQGEQESRDKQNGHACTRPITNVAHCLAWPWARPWGRRSSSGRQVHSRP